MRLKKTRGLEELEEQAGRRRAENTTDRPSPVQPLKPVARAARPF